MLKPVNKSIHYKLSHIHDNYTDLGYKYEGHIFERTVSKPLMLNWHNKGFFKKLDAMFSYLVNTTKQIKLQYMIALSKNDTKVN